MPSKPLGYGPWKAPPRQHPFSLRGAMPSPVDRVYSDSHEWHRLDGDIVTLGVTQFAVNELTDITYVEMKPVGTTVQPKGAVGEIESVKATSDIYSAVGGTIVEINKALAEDPSLVNSDPYGRGWLVKIKVSDPSPLKNLLTQEAYDKQYS